MNGAKFTTAGIIIVGTLVWLGAQNASGDGRKVMNWFLFVLLVSIILSRWSVIGPFLFKQSKG